jgi:subtilase family serine protease
VARRLLLAAAGALTLTTAALAPTAQAAPTPATLAQATTRVTTAHACATPTKGHASCLALRRTDPAAVAAGRRMADAMAQARERGQVAAATTPAGYGPGDIRSAYKLTNKTSNGRTVAVVDAYDDPKAESDLAIYRSQYLLPACTTANGCFKKINQSAGTSSYPAGDTGWAEEISLDLDMVSATCPDCKILLVEATSASFADLGTAVNTAAKQPGVVAISNSYGGGDVPDSIYGSYYNHPGIAVTASSGDSGYGASFPADSSYVTAVGGTHLVKANNTRGWTETVWSGAGSGCSRYNTALQAASSFNTGCSRRAEADVSAVADPNTGVAVYDSYGVSGWLQFGGTSASAPIIASVYALAGGGYTNAYPYQRASASTLFDVTSGSNGSCSPTQLCHARTGWDGPTGLGTPNGTGAF